MRTIHVIVEGTVQGVGFRYTTRREAQHRDLAGWVRNRQDGSVEVWAQGPPEAVAKLIAFLEKGPPGATVSKLEIEEVDADLTMHKFEFRY